SSTRRQGRRTFVCFSMSGRCILFLSGVFAQCRALLPSQMDLVRDMQQKDGIWCSGGHFSRRCTFVRVVGSRCPGPSPFSGWGPSRRVGTVQKLFRMKSWSREGPWVQDPLHSRPACLMPKKDPYGREVLWRKLRRAALRRQHSIQVADSDGEGGVSRKAKRKGSDKPRSRSRKKKRSKSSSSSSMGVAGRMQAAIRPNAMPMKTLGMAAYADMTTGGFGMLPSGYSNATGSMDGAKTCMKYLAGCCPLGTSCPNNHPSDPADMARWIQYFNKLPCKSGANCTNDKCLYEHPNKPTWNGVYHAAGGTSL
ncbi:unnamed protein product, partial [Prorocentrum cordatum]